jgi:hypothetical protein
LSALGAPLDKAFDAAFEATAWDEDVAPAGTTLDADIRSHPFDSPGVPSAGMGLAQFDHITEAQLHGWFRHLLSPPDQEGTHEEGQAGDDEDDHADGLLAAGRLAHNLGIVLILDEAVAGYEGQPCKKAQEGAAEVAPEAHTR